MRRTTISHFSFLISHSIEAFITNQGGGTSTRLTLNPEPKNKKPDMSQVFLFALFIMQCIDRIQLRRLLCRIEAENKADQDREDEGTDDGSRCDDSRDL